MALVRVVRQTGSLRARGGAVSIRLHTSPIGRDFQSLHTRTRHSFSTSSARFEQHSHRKESFSSRLKAALGNTKVIWYPIPVGLGIASLGLLQFYKIQKRENAARLQEAQNKDDGFKNDGEAEPDRPKKRPRIRPSGPW